MARGRKSRQWIKLYCYGVLHGSIAYKLTLEERAVWILLLAFSEECGGEPGFIQDNDGRAIPHEYIAHQLYCPVDVLRSTLKKCELENMIKENSNGIEILHFNDYQFTEYDRQRPYREAKKARVTQEDMFKADAETISGQSIDTAILIAQGKMSGVPAKQIKFMQDALDMKKIPWKQGGTG